MIVIRLNRGHPNRFADPVCGHSDLLLLCGWVHRCSVSSDFEFLSCARCWLAQSFIIASCMSVLSRYCGTRSCFLFPKQGVVFTCRNRPCNSIMLMAFSAWDPWILGARRVISDLTTMELAGIVWYLVRFALPAYMTRPEQQIACAVDDCGVHECRQCSIFSR